MPAGLVVEPGADGEPPVSFPLRSNLVEEGIVVSCELRGSITGVWVPARLWRESCQFLGANGWNKRLSYVATSDQRV